MTLDQKLVSAAKEQFKKEFSPQIKGLGYHLQSGVSKTEEDSFYLVARVQSNLPFSNAVK